MSESTGPACSIVIPARNEAESITSVLDRIGDAVTLAFECVVVVDEVIDPAETRAWIVSGLHAATRA